MKQHFFVLISLVTLSFSLLSCEENENKDLTPNVNKDGAVETSITVEHADSLHDVLVTKHTIWNKGTAAGNVEHRDTIPALGASNATVKDDFGYDKTVNAKKEYEIFITVK